MIKPIGNGSGISATLLIDGQPVIFNLALAIDCRWRNSSTQDKDLSYIYVSDNGLYIEGLYSGGITGFGQDRYRPLSNEWNIIATDLSEIQRIAQEVEKRQLEYEDKYKASIRRKVNLVNMLPTEKELFSAPLSTGTFRIILRRTPAEYIPEKTVKYSGRVTPYIVFNDLVGNLLLTNTVTQLKHYLPLTFGATVAEEILKEITGKDIIKLVDKETKNFMNEINAIWLNNENIG